MPRLPAIAFFLADTDHPVLPGTDLWERHLPADRLGAKDPTLRYKDYFRAVTDFLDRDNGRHLIRALSAGFGRPIDAGQVDSIDIFLEKHGAFYHPCRVRVRCGQEALSLVVNVAVSAQGRAVIENEYRALHHLSTQGHQDLVPGVYAMERVDLGNGCDLPMFMGQWFDGFNEFHWSRERSGAGTRIRVWDPDSGSFALNEHQTLSLFQEAARILTSIYDPQHLRQVAGWHHAAGDFVVRLDPQGAPELRLITVRSYTPVMDADAGDPRSVVEGLVLFVLGLTLRMRLDRLDGVGDAVWAVPDILPPVVAGFFHSIIGKEASRELPQGFAGGFLRYLGDYPEEGWLLLARQIAAGFSDSDRTLAEAGLTGHLAGLKTCFADLLASL